MWFTENAVAPILILIVAAVALTWLWLSQRRGIWLMAAVVMFGGAVAVFFVERAIVTDAERIEKHVVDLTTAFRKKDETATLAYFSKQAPELRDLVLKGMKMVDIEEDLDIKDMSVRMLTGGTEALSHFRANATISAPSLGGMRSHAPSRWELRWQKEATDWKIVEVIRLDPLKEERRDVLDPRM